MEGDLETAPLQVLNEVQIVGIVQGLRTSEVTTALRAGNRPYRLGRPQSKPFEQAVDGTDIGYGRDIGIVDDGEGESLSLRQRSGSGGAVEVSCPEAAEAAWSAWTFILRLLSLAIRLV